MNYSTLKSMIESLISGYACPSCLAKNISEQDIDVVGAAGNTVNIDMKCPTCQKHYMAKMEVVGLNLSDASKFSNPNIGKINVSSDVIKRALQQAKTRNTGGIQEISLQETIKDDQIVNLSKNLKSRKFSVEDLFNQ